MNQQKFFLQLVIITLVLAGLVLLLSFIPLFKPFIGFLLFSVGFYLVLSVCIFFLAAKAAISKDKNAFTRLIMAMTFCKLLLTVVLVIIYQRMAKPTGISFVIPFFIIYFAFTIFETMFLTKLGKIKAR